MPIAAMRVSDRAYMPEVKIHIEAANALFYPDVLVTAICSLIVEVLSPSTEACDRGQDFIADLQEYALIGPGSRRIEIRRAGTAGEWVLSEVDTNATLILESIGVEINAAEIFQNV